MFNDYYSLTFNPFDKQQIPEKDCFRSKDFNEMMSRLNFLYELSPSLIGLSLLPSTHPEAFQRLSVRSSSWFYPNFNLVKGRSLGFASTTAYWSPY